jgi:DNA-binding MarR family transcriptional regulator
MISAVDRNDQPPVSARPDEDVQSLRLGYLLKHVYLRFGRLTSAELEPLGISPLEWAALSCVDEQREHSQREMAELLGIDRTKMVALIDELERKGCVERRVQPVDRRKNIVTLTDTGRQISQRGGRLIDDCERRFLAVLNDSDARQLRRALYAVMATNR